MKTYIENIMKEIEAIVHPQPDVANDTCFDNEILFDEMSEYKKSKEMDSSRSMYTYSSSYLIIIIIIIINVIKLTRMHSSRADSDLSTTPKHSLRSPVKLHKNTPGKSIRSHVEYLD
jgi:hypothetical protein